MTRDIESVLTESNVERVEREGVEVVWFDGMDEQVRETYEHILDKWMPVLSGEGWVEYMNGLYLGADDLRSLYRLGTICDFLYCHLFDGWCMGQYDIKPSS